MDWNWYYAALAQSFAAIVGVVGALLVARLMAHESSRREWMRDAATWVADCNHHYIECNGLQTEWLNSEERRDDEWFTKEATAVHEKEGNLTITNWTIRLLEGFGWHENEQDMAEHLKSVLPDDWITETAPEGGA